MNPNYSTIKTSEKAAERADKTSERTRERRDPAKDVANELSTALANTYSIYLKTQNYHWNVTGPLFGTLHRIFDEQYHELAKAVDKIAERIRAVGAFAPATFKQLSDIGDIKEDSTIPPAEHMLENLVDDHSHIATLMRESIRICDSCNDVASSDLLTKRVCVHEKYAWMLRSFSKSEQHSPRAQH